MSEESLTCTRSMQRRVFSDHQLHCCWQPNLQQLPEIVQKHRKTEPVTNELAVVMKTVHITCTMYNVIFLVYFQLIMSPFVIVFTCVAYLMTFRRDLSHTLKYSVCGWLYYTGSLESQM